jgi:hypothetical protein
MLKKSLKILFGIIAFLAVLIVFLLSDFNPIYKNDDFIFITKEVKKAQKEDFENFIFTYNKIYTKIKEPNCPCQNVANNIRFDPRNRSLAKRVLYWIKIKKEFTHDECLKFILKRNDFCFDNIGIKEASRFYFKKDLKQLNEREIVTLIVMYKNPALYNPIRNKERLETKVLLFQKTLHH